MKRFCITACTLTLIMLLAPSMVLSQSTPKAPVAVQHEGTALVTVRGVVRDSRSRPIVGANVCLQGQDASIRAVHTDSAGVYIFPEVHPGSYTLRAEINGYVPATSRALIVESEESKTFDFILDSARANGSKNQSRSQPEFFDEPHFTVAGVTDTTNLGGHGGDTIVRNREALAQATASLGKPPAGTDPRDSSADAMENSLRDAVTRRPQDFDANFRLGQLLVERAKPQEGLPYLEQASRLNPDDLGNSYELALACADLGGYTRARSAVRALLAVPDQSHQENAELHHLLAEADEALGDSLEAVREFQRAAELNPSESNLFDWGTELLLHRAAEPAIEVFEKGNRAFPRSVRMLSGLGAAWYSHGSYDQAAQRFGEASDLNPNDPNPYLLMGKLQAVENAPSAALDERLARFVRLQPQSAWANYYYAVNLQKRWRAPEDVEDVDQVKSLLEAAIHLDPKLGLAYLQLGIVYSEQENYPKAISALQQATAVAPQLEMAHYRLAQLYRLTGETSKAQSELRVYEKISNQETEAIARQRHELQQFVYELRDRPPAPAPK
jgi:tetratricopeptide (TPR) repeat protein